MIIFKDAIAGDELFSDIYKMELIDGVLYKVHAKQVTVSGDCDVNIGGNPSAEEAADVLSENSVSGINVLMASRLVETTYTKKTYQKHIKEYMGKIKTRLEEAGKPEELKTFLKGAATQVKAILGEFDEWQFYLGETMNIDGMVVLVKWDGETPYIYFFKHGLEEEKV